MFPFYSYKCNTRLCYKQYIFVTDTIHELMLFINKVVIIVHYRYNDDMEKCQRKVNSFSVTRSVYLMGLFDWKLVKEEKHDNAPSILYFERDENVPYYAEMVAVEKETSPKLLPFWILIAVVAVAFLVMTTYLILWLALRPNFDSLKYF